MIGRFDLVFEQLISSCTRRSLTLPVGGHSLAAEWVEPPGAPGGEPVVLLHEGLGSIAQWVRRDVDVPARLAAATGRPAFLHDRLGFGRSDPLPRQRTPRYLYEEAWETLPRVLDAAGIDRAALVGHSDGASIALLLAAKFPDRVTALVSEAAHSFVEDVTLAGIVEARAAFHAPDGRLRKALARFHGDKTDATFSGWADVWLKPGFAAFDMRGELARITCPVLAIQGEGDEYGTPRQLDAIAEAVAGPVETWLVEDCRHIPHFQAADRVLPRIADFLAAHTRNP